MRILHTSDWHLGRTFGDHSLAEVQGAFIRWVVEVTAAEGIDLVVIAGDLHDRAVPAAEAVTLLSDAIRSLRATGAHVAAIAGNHDSAARVAAFDGLVDAGGVLLRGGYGACSTVTELTLGDERLSLVATPFLDPLLAPSDFREGSTERRLTHEHVLRRALDTARAQLTPGVPSLVLSHAFVTGAAPSDSERDLSVGDAGMVSATAYDGFDYVALGHLHRPQMVGGRDTVRYSGSPLAYSFSETQAKEIAIVELTAGRPARVTTVPVGVGHQVRTIRGAFHDILNGPPETDAWVRVELTDTLPVIDAHRRLRDRFPLLVEIARVGQVDTAESQLRTAEVQTRTPRELATAFWHEVTDTPAADDVAELLGQVLHDAAAEPTP